MVDRHADRALYLQLADVLRNEISSGRLKPGHRLPSESELIQRHGVSRGTAREAIGTLRGEGLVVVEHGRGAFVKEAGQAALVRQVTSGADFVDARRNFQEQVGSHGKVASIRRVSGQLLNSLPTTLSHVMKSDFEGPGVLWLGFADGRPVALTRAWQGDGDSAVGDSVREYVTSRMPTRDERRLLQLDDGTPTLVLDRLLRHKERIVEISSSLIPSERQSLCYTLGA